MKQRVNCQKSVKETINLESSAAPNGIPVDLRHCGFDVWLWPADRTNNLDIYYVIRWIRPHRPANQGPCQTNLQRAGCAQCKGAGALGSESTAGGSECGCCLDRRYRLWRFQHVWRTDQYAEPGKDRRERAQVQSLSYHCSVFSDTSRIAHRLQPSQQQCRFDHGNGDCISRQQRREAPVDYADGGSSPSEWI